MTSKRRVKGSAAAMPAGIGIGVAAALAAALVGCGITAYLTVNSHIPQSAMGYWAMAVLGISAAIGALTAFGCVKSRRVQVCMITGGGFYLTLLAMTALFFGGQYQGMGTAAVMVLLGSGCVALTGIPIKKGRKIKGLKRSYR